MQVVLTRNAPAPAGHYSQAIVHGGVVYVAGQLPIDPATGEMPKDVKEQARLALHNVEAVLAAGGSGLKNAIKLTVFLDNMDDFAAVNEVYAEIFDTGAPFPARSAVEVARLPKPGALIEIEAIGFKS